MVDQAPEFESSDYAYSDFDHTIITVGTTQVEIKVGTNRMVRREYVYIHNNSNPPIFIGKNGVTTSGSTKGDILYKDQFAYVRVDDDTPVYVIAASSNADVFIREGY